MGSFVEGALKLTIGLFWNKARSSVAEKLKDGDLNSQKLRSLIVSNMEDIKGKLDGAARRELLSSVSYVEEGLFLLNDLIDSEKHAIHQQGGLQQHLHAAFDYVLRMKRWLTSDKEDGVPTAINTDYLDLLRRNSENTLPWDLEDGVKDLKLHSLEQFKAAMQCFEHANTRATDTFFNESLNIEDRILAAKLRVYSRLLLSLENPTMANVCRRLHLKELHELSAIAEVFRYDLEGGMLSMFNEAKRHELVQSVSLINFVVFRYLTSFTTEPVNVYDWPLIQSDDWMYNPLLPHDKITMELLRANVMVPNLLLMKLVEPNVIGVDPSLVAINSDGDLFLFRQRTNPEVCELLKVSGGKVEVFYTFTKFTLVSFLVINRDNLLYVFADDIESSVPDGHIMYDVYIFQSDQLTPALIFDKHLLPYPERTKVYLRVPKRRSNDEQVIGEDKVQVDDDDNNDDDDDYEMMEYGAHNYHEYPSPSPAQILKHHLLDGTIVLAPTPPKISVALCVPKKHSNEEQVIGEDQIQGENDKPDGEKSQGEKDIPGSLISKIEMSGSSLATITDELKMMIVEKYGYRVRVFNQDGTFVQEFELAEGESEACVAITFNSVTKEVVFVTCANSGYFLSAYCPKTGERRHYVRLSHIGKDCKNVHLTSHWRGSMALITEEHVLYIQ
ncbi:Hypothetical predicted protein [Paramuricea clavata]|uniref:Uncharacterized protein n=1 Tax=Paramuricea clavata TaxID=317549 RepID=A0A6S7INZ4_PARCT|nr:Hypothetical predicted protein [Paramuricea clavata]